MNCISFVYSRAKLVVYKFEYDREFTFLHSSVCEKHLNKKKNETMMNKHTYETTGYETT